MTDQPTGPPDDPRSGPELEFLQRWRPLIDRVGGDGGQARAAKHMNWTTSTVSRDYKGATLPTDERLLQLCSALQLSPNETLALARLLRQARSARRDRTRNHGARNDGAQDHGVQDHGGRLAAEAGGPGHAVARRADWLRGRRGRVVAAVVAVAAVAVIAAAFGLSGSGGAPPVKSTIQTKVPADPAPTAKGTFPGLALDAVPIPVASLSPSLARAFRQAHDATATGFVFRNGGNTGLCLTAVNSGPKAGKNHDPVLVTDCSHAADEIWIPEQWETSGSHFTHLVNDQYQSMCLNADNLGGLHDGHIVQLWNCYHADNESWDFGDWHTTVRAGGTSYPLFVQSRRLCLDADKYDLRVGTPVRIWDQYTAANQFWS